MCQLLLRIFIVPGPPPGIKPNIDGPPINVSIAKYYIFLKHQCGKHAPDNKRLA